MFKEKSGDRHWNVSLVRRNWRKASIVVAIQCRSRKFPSAYWPAPILKPFAENVAAAIAHDRHAWAARAKTNDDTDSNFRNVHNLFPAGACSAMPRPSKLAALRHRRIGTVVTVLLENFWFFFPRTSFAQSGNQCLNSSSSRCHRFRATSLVMPTLAATCSQLAPLRRMITSW